MKKKNIQTTLFGHILKKSTHPLFGVWSLLVVHIRFKPTEGPKGVKNCIFQKCNHGSVTMENGQLTQDKFMVHDVNNPYIGSPYIDKPYIGLPHDNQGFMNLQPRACADTKREKEGKNRMWTCRPKKMHFGDLKSCGLSYKTEVVRGQVPCPITYFRGAREDFMVHDASNLQF